MKIDEKIKIVHEVIEKIVSNPYRPNYHFCVPFDLGFPADPNAPFYYKGKYHLFYIYENRNDSYRWGHAISNDLLHWTYLPDALFPDSLDGGIYSGGIYLKDDTAYVAYWALGHQGKVDGIRIATSKGPDFTKWEKQENLIIENFENGIAKVKDLNGNIVEIGSADPSNIWENNGKYYMQLGNLCILNKYRDKDNSFIDIKGDHAYLLESKDLFNWNYIGEFYQRNKDNKYTDESEDCMCPYFGKLPLGKNAKTMSEKYIQLFLSHNKGTQYYIGKYDKSNNKFIIESHGRMSFIDNCLFAPEAMKNHDGRLISFYWQRDNIDDDLTRELESYCSGIHSLPRELFLHNDNQLGIAPIREIEKQRITIFENKKTYELPRLNKAIFNTDCCEIVVKNTNKSFKGKVGIKIDLANQGVIEIYLNYSNNTLVFDLSKSNSLGRKVKDIAPIKLDTINEQFIDIFIDKCIIDVFACNYQAISRQVFDLSPNNRTISFINEYNNDISVSIYEIMPTNAF